MLKEGKLLSLEHFSKYLETEAISKGNEKLKGNSKINQEQVKRLDSEDTNIFFNIIRGNLYFEWFQLQK